MKYKYSLPWFNGKWLLTDKKRYFVIWKMFYPIFDYFLPEKIRNRKDWLDFNREMFR